ncbi:thioester-containing protein 1 allele S1-like [Haematobia irritans]|uniref:thioester-containing protein 1 allele S1-like n=1 Tax=Haematobia irritans TaxID=7368 RepID=UPI003F4F4AAC
MSQRCYPYLLVILIASITPVLCLSHYSIVAPGTIRSNRNYSVCISLHNAPTDAIIRLTISSQNSSFSLSQDVSLQPYESKLVEFIPPKLNGRFQYALNAQGVKGISLDRTKKLYVLTNGGPRVYIESDKALYKPEDIVQFRVIVLDEHVQVTKIIEPIRIQILDAQRNRVKQFKDIQLDRGVYAAKFQLSKQPILGTWTISVHISGKYDMDKEYTFKVEKYVLPKFSVHIENDRYLPRQDGILKATVYGKYTYGKYVKGTVDIVVLESTRDFKFSKNQTLIIDNDDVKADLIMDVRDFDYSWKVYILATMKEKLTNATATTESEILFAYNRYNLFVPLSEIEFRDGQPYRLKLHVENWNGSPVRDNSTAAIMRLSGKEYSSHLDDKGIAQFEFDYEPSSTFGFQFKDTKFTYDNTFVEHTSYDTDDSNCKITMKPRRSVDLSEPIEIDVSDSQTLPYLIYTLTSHGNIIRKEFIRLPGNTNSHTIKIKASMAMIPNSYLFVYYIIEDKLHYCEFTIRLPKMFVNQLAITAPNTVKPGQNITMNIKGRPNSRISIVAVDKSVLLMDSSNILRKDTIMDDLLYDRSYGVQHINDYEYIYSPGYSAGLIIFTSGKYDEHVFRIPLEPSPYNNPTPIRSIFPETWIFKDFDITKANSSLTLRVPDTITTWIVRAFSVNDETGFGMLEEHLNIESFQPFFISVNLPYSIRRGETVTIPVTIFNYLQQNHATMVSMKGTGNDDFQIMDDANHASAKKEDIRNITVPANNGKSLEFRISPKRIGYIDIQITANNSITSDAVLHRLKVEPEGIVHNHNQDELFTLSNGESKTITFQANIPRDIVSESEYLVLSISGDIMGTTLDNLEDLVQKPTGCGEQNMINFVPNILILDYLKSRNHDNNQQSALMTKAKNFIDTGYQQELTYRHPNGAYSVFGPEKSTESNWLTAYVIRFFIKGLKYSAIEPRIIEEGLKYLSTQQMEDGSFPHRGHLFKPAHQNQYGFTAFVMLTFLEDGKFSRKFNTVIDKAMQFLYANVDRVQDTYSLALLANAFENAGNSSQAQNILTKLDSMAREENGLKWWTSNNKNEESANDVEITAYILLALPEVPNNQYLPIFNWLIKQRNPYGGYGSTHDTVVGLQALIKYAGKLSQAQNTLLKVHYIAMCDNGKNVKENILGVDSDNELILQKEELPRNTRSVKVDIMGTGRIYLQLSYQYYISDLPKVSALVPPKEIAIPSEPSTTSIQFPNMQPRMFQSIAAIYEYFTIKPTAKRTASNAMSLDICCTYRPMTEEEKFTNMVILEVQFPSGFTANPENIEKLRDEEFISRIDSRNDGTKLMIYFEKLEGNEEQCLNILADKGFQVDSLKPSAIVMYDFYDDKRRSTTMYQI